MKKLSLCSLVALLATTFGAHAAREAFPAPNCSSSAAACKEWQQAIKIANDDAANLQRAGGQQSPAPRNKEQVMTTCVHYQESVKHMPPSTAQSTCRAMYMGL